MVIVRTISVCYNKHSNTERGNYMRIIRNKTTGQCVKQHAHLIHGQYLFLPINEYWEVLPQSEIFV